MTTARLEGAARNQCVQTSQRGAAAYATTISASMVTVAVSEFET